MSDLFDDDFWIKPKSKLMTNPPFLRAGDAIICQYDISSVVKERIGVVSVYMKNNPTVIKLDGHEAEIFWCKMKGLAK